MMEQRKRRKVIAVITTPSEAQKSEELTTAVQNLLNILANNYNIKAETIIKYYSLFQKAPNEIIGMFNALSGGSMNLVQMGQWFNAIRKKLK